MKRPILILLFLASVSIGPSDAELNSGGRGAQIPVNRGESVSLPQAGTLDTTIERAREHIRDIMIENEIPGVSIAVAKNGRIVWEEGFGWADIEHRRRVDPHTAFGLASITKPITATAVMILAKRGLIGLDRPINDYLGVSKLTAYVGRAEDATVRRVLNHTAGLPWHFNMYYADEAIPRPAFDESVRKYGTIVTLPGETYQYSNFGYALLEHAIEQVSRQSYARFVDDEVFQPLGMRDSFISLPGSRHRNTAVRYMAPGRPVPFFDTDHRGAASVFASADDLLRFGLFHLDQLKDAPHILSAADVSEMHTYEGEIDAGGSRYGLGWEITDISGQRVFRHTGGMPGVDSELVAVPSQALVIVVLANRNTEHRRDITDLLLRAFGSGFRPPDDRAALARAASGKWSGFVSLQDGGRLPISIQSSEQSVSVTLAGKDIPIELVKSRWNGFFEIALDGGSIPAMEARRDAHRVRLMLKRRCDMLSGYATTLTRPRPDRWGRTLSYWTELRALAHDPSTDTADSAKKPGLPNCGPTQ